MKDTGDYEGWPATAAVIGAGTMGLGVAECFAAAGVSVRLVDATPELTLRARERLIERARGHAEAGLLTGEAFERVAEVEAADGVPAAVRGVGLVFEAVARTWGSRGRSCPPAPRRRPGGRASSPTPRLFP